MGYELRELIRKIDEISRDVNQMIPDVKHCAKEIDLINAKQGIITTIMQKHDTTIDFHTADLREIGAQVDELQINQAIYRKLASAAGEPIKWASFIEFLIVLPKYWRSIVAIGISLLSLIGMIFGYKHHG